ncbi:type II secretion system protein N [Castellaniella sp.]|uniref:type II secretion system protein N n=1 Tax=Castellaniella sp. TaxID=1955812 RepID=UPI002AFF7F5A|nr:type II secretion system protein N [Castellaniella sp.]
MSAPALPGRTYRRARHEADPARRPARLAGVLALAAVAVVVALSVLPARWVMAWVPETALVTVTDARGSLWSAQASLAIGTGPLRRSLPEPLHWRLAWAGGLRLVVSHPWLRGSLEIRPAWGGLRISGQTLQVPAAALTTLHAMFNTLEPGGELLLQWPELLVSRSGPQATPGQPLLLARWRNARSALSRVAPLGDYRLSVEAAAGPEPAYALKLRTDKGPLRLEGDGMVTLAGRLRFDGKARPDDSAPIETQAALRRLLDVLGPKAGPDGATPLRMHS